MTASQRCQFPRPVFPLHFLPVLLLGSVLVHNVIETKFEMKKQCQVTAIMPT